MLYLYTQPFTSGQDTPFWQTLISSVQHGAEDTVFLTATRGMQANLKHQMVTWVSKEGLLPEVLTLDDLVFSVEDGFAALGFSHVYILEKLLAEQKYKPLCGDHPPSIIAQTLFETFSELQKQAISPSQLQHAFQSPHKLASGKKTKHVQSQAEDNVLSTLFHDFLEAGQKWPFPSIYTHYITALDPHKTKKLQDWRGKSIFILGFWETPPYQQPLLAHIIQHASVAALQLNYSPLSPIYDAAEPMYRWLRQVFPDLREIPFEGTAIRPKIDVLICNTPTEEIQIALELATKNSDTGLLIPESDPYHDLLHRYVNTHSLWATEDIDLLPTDIPLFSFIMALLDPGLPSTASISRIFSHILVTQSIPDWHWPQVESDIRTQIGQWTWSDWEHALQPHGRIPHSLLKIAAQIHRDKPLSQVFQQCCEASSLLGHPLSSWPASLITGFSQATSLASRLGGDPLGRLRQILKSILSTPSKLPKSWPCYGKFESHMIQKKNWILIGCRDGVWPKVTRKAYALPGPVSRKLGLPSSRHYAEADAYFFHAVLHQATDRITAIYPRTHEDIPQALTLFLSGFDVREASPHKETKGYSPLDTGSENPSATGQNPEVLRHTSGDIRIDPTHLTTIQTSTFSPTRLERYQTCPYQYYLKHILKLPEAPPSLDISNGTIGELIHDVFQTLTAMMRQTGQPHTAEMIQHAVRSSITKHQSRYGNTSMRSWLIAAKAASLLGTEIMPGIIPETLNALSEEGLPLSSIAEEVSLGENQSLAFSVMSTDFYLTGRIDAIYAIQDSDMILIVDYKTGSKPYAKKDLETYKNLQLPLYILMAQKQYPDKKVVGAAIIYTRHREPGIDIMAITAAGKSALDLKRKRPKMVDEIYHHDTLFHTASVIESIREGRFGLQNVPVAEAFLPKRKETCAHCHYRWICDFPERWESFRS
jgi:hypothetical protein